MGNLAQAFDQLVPHGGNLSGILIDMVAGLLQGSSHTADGRDILRTGPLAPLLGAALDDVHQREALADIQRTHALGAMELVAGKAQHIDVLFLHIDVQVTGSLNGIGVEGHTGLLADGADLGNGQDGADLIVGIHGGHQAGIRPNGILHLLGGDIVALVHIQQLDFKTFLFQLLQGVQHGMVLKSGGNNVLLALLLSQTGGGNNGLVVGFRSAGGEDNLPGLTAQALRHGLPGGIQGLLGLLAHGVQAGRVAVNRCHIRQHGIDGRLAHLGRCRVIRVNLHEITSYGLSRAAPPGRSLPSSSVGSIPHFAYLVNR